MRQDVTHGFQLPLLPPQIDLQDKNLVHLLIKARAELAELKGYCSNHLNLNLLLSPAIIRESLASSEIENIHTTVSDLLEAEFLHEKDRKGANKEVLHYREAILWGNENLPKVALSNRLVLGIKQHLLPDTTDGYRKIPNAIKNMATNEIVYTPPPAAQVPNLMQNWETFANTTTNSDMDPLIKAVIAHYQFEAIHPFEDGNGRTGRILLVLQLVHDQILQYPTLFISGYINAHKSDYYRLLKAITTDGNWNDFITFMLQGFYDQAVATKKNLLTILELAEQLKKTIKWVLPKLYSGELVETLCAYPIITRNKLATDLEISTRTASRYLQDLKEAKILRYKKVGRNHFFINTPLLSLLSK